VRVSPTAPRHRGGRPRPSGLPGRARGRPWGAVILVAVACLSLLPPGLCAQSTDEARAALFHGDYERAISDYRTLVRRGADFPAADRGLVAALSAVGRYDDAEAAARASIRAHSASAAELSNALGEVLWRLGRTDEARTQFERAIGGGASDRLQARLNLAVLRYQAGERERAMADFDGFIDVYNSGGARTSEELAAVATAVAYLGQDDWNLLRDAQRAYEEAIAADEADPGPRVQLGELFLAKYNSQDADELFREALAINPSHPGALLGLARRAYFDGKAEAAVLTRKSLEVNPNLVDARVFEARLHLDNEDYGAAVDQAEAALDVNPSSLTAMAMLAATRLLQGDRAGFDALRQRAFAINPLYSDFYVTVAEVAVRNRFYAEAVELARKAVDIDPRSWHALAVLGTNQLRLGAMAEGRANLEAAFAGDPYNLWVKNTLDLLDTLDEYPETRSERFRFYIDPRESELLTLYLSDLAEEAYDRLAERYGYRPETPIRLEVYARHADFSVRTMGLAGLAALGVAFGNVLAMDSPSAHEPGHFSWGSTFWHELSHTVTLGMTGHKVPRWFTEGLAVYDETLARPGWGYELRPEFLMVYKAGGLLPIAELNAGFVRPTYPQQVIFSYYQASLICEMLETEDGWPAILAMLEGYRDGLDTPEVLRAVLRLSPEEFDRRFDAFLEQKFALALAALPEAEPGDGAHQLPPPRVGEDAEPGDFRAQLMTGRTLYEAERYEEAIESLDRAKRLFPEYAGAGSPYWFLARSYKALGRPRLAIQELTELIARNAGYYEAILELALLLEGAGDLEGSAAALEQVMFVYPLELSLHERLAELYARMGEPERAVRERKAVLALQPVDRAEALYQLALAQFEAGRVREARKALLEVLENAPHFEKAQDLLLRVHEADGRDQTTGDST
jgi:tetratricopeptide (TPR) repeat protein